MVALLLVLGAGHDLWRARTSRGVARVEHPTGAGLDQDSIRWRVGDPGPAGTSRGETPSRGTPGIAPSIPTVSVNRADVAELDELPGIGPVLAGRIVAHREAHGPFRRVEDLLAVRGIGPRLLERLRTHVVIER